MQLQIIKISHGTTPFKTNESAEAPNILKNCLRSRAGCANPSAGEEESNTGNGQLVCGRWHFYWMQRHNHCAILNVRITDSPRFQITYIVVCIQRKENTYFTEVRIMERLEEKEKDTDTHTHKSIKTTSKWHGNFLSNFYHFHIASHFFLS